MSAPAPAPGHRLSPEDPWLGLDSYQEQDQYMFFGRRKEAEGLLRMIRSEVLTVLFGPAGTGKTSLLNAGVFPALRRDNYLPVRIRLDYLPGSQPPDRQVLTALEEAIGAHPLEREDLYAFAVAEEFSLWEYLHRKELWDARNQLHVPILFFDQFEEVFTLGRGHPATAPFLAELAAIIENHLPDAVRVPLEQGVKMPPCFEHQRYKVVLSLREDFVHRLDSLRPAMPSVMYNRFPLDRMNGEQAKEAVLGPGERIVNDPIAERIVRFVAAADAGQRRIARTDPTVSLKDLEVEPALLSLVCLEHNRRRVQQGASLITAEQIEDSQTGILNEFYERSCAGLSRDARIFIEERLLTESGFRNSAPVEEALRTGFSEADVDALVDRRLIRIEFRFGTRQMELIHDRLIKVVEESKNARCEQERRAAEEAAERNRLLKIQRSRRWTIGALLATVLVLGVATWVLYSLTQKSRRESSAHELATYAKLNLQVDQEKSLLWAIGAVEATVRRGEPAVPEALDALHRAVLASHIQTEGTFDLAKPVSAVAFSPDGNRIAIASGETAIIRDLVSAKTLTLVKHDRPITAVVFSPNGELLGTASKDESAKLWDARSGSLVLSLEPHKGTVTGLAFSLDGARLATSSWERTLTIWDLRSGTPLFTRSLEGRLNFLWTVAFSPDGKLLATGSDDGSFQLWDAQSYRLLSSVTGHREAVYSVAFSPDGSQLATASADKTAGIWQVSSGHLKTRLSGHESFVRGVAFSPDGDLIATASADNTARLWDSRTFEEKLTLSGHRGPVQGLSFRPGGKHIATASEDHTVRLWNVAPISGELSTIPENAGALAFSPDGTRFATASDDGTARIWDAISGSPRGLVNHEGLVLGLAFSPDGKRIATASMDGTVGLWDSLSDQQLSSLTVLRGTVLAVTFSPNGKLLATADGDNRVRLWNAATRKELRTLAGNTDLVSALAFSPNGKYLVAASNDKASWLWDCATGTVVRTFQGHTDAVTSVAFSMDGNLIATASADRTVKLWDLNGKELRTLPVSASMVAFTRGDLLATGGTDGTITLWEPSATIVLRLHGHRDAVTALAFSPNGGKLVSCGLDKTVQVYAMDSRDLLALARRRITRTLTPEECGAYRITCPVE
jgi:WD40 repeat protein